MKTIQNYRTRQQGSALVISLVILTSITMGAVIAMQRSSGQLRMVNSMHSQQEVFHAAHTPFRQIRQSLGESLLIDWIEPLYKKEIAAVAAGKAVGSIVENPATTINNVQLLVPPARANRVATVTNQAKIVKLPKSNGSSNLRAASGSSAKLANSRLIFENRTVASAGNITSSQRVYYFRVINTGSN